MANQEQIPPQQDQPFVAAKQVSFNLEDINLNTNNKVALLYPEHNNQDYFKCVSDFISKCCLRKPFTRSPNMYKEYLAEFWYSAIALENSKIYISIPTGGIFGEVGVNTIRNAIDAHYLAHSSEYVTPPSIDIVRQWFPTIGYGEEVSAKGTLKKNLLPPRWSKEATKGGSSKAPTGFKTGHSKKRKESSSAMDSNPSQPPVSTPVDPGMQKEDHQATGGPTSLGVTRNDALAVSTAADPGNSAPRKGASSIAKQVKEEEASSTIKLEDLAKLVSNVQPCFKDLNSPKDDHVIIIEESDEENYQIHATKNVETEDSSVSKSSSPKYSLIQELTNQVLILQSQKNKLELKKNKVEAKAALLKAQPSFPNVEQLNELLVKSLKTKFSNILTARDLSNSLPTELKDISSKLNELTGKVQGLKKQVHDLEIELPEELNEIPTKLEDCLLSNVTKALNKFAQVLDSASSKDGDQSVPSAGQTNTMPAEGEKNTNQVAISQLFRRRAEKKDKGKKDLSSEEAEKESTKSGSNDETTHMPGSTVESYKKKELKKFDFVTESGEHVHLTKEQISAQKKIEEEAKAEAARREGEIRKEELIDLLGLDVVNKHYNDKLQYDKYYDKMLNRRAASRITNCDVLTKKGPITLKVYKEDGTSEIIPNFKVSDLHLGEWREVMEACPKRTGKG
ncbi:hypothetical protein Tco_0952963 [Tanacetum coccineum]|uniref:Uncharacterized protein n=1 Tax=Tanacetum coccineum TaxID=301880 RepID=A0ABQ5E1D3_9ASTR